MNIEGSIALVTGANRGLGATYAEALLERAAAKVYAAVRDVSSVGDRRAPPRACDAGGKPVMSGDLLDTATARCAKTSRSGRSDGHDDDYEETSPCNWHSVP